MATFVNNLRLKEITTGDESGTWGDSTNTNLELITDAFGTGTLQLAADANETFTIADGTADDARAMVLDITSAGSLTATRTVTLAPNTVNKVWVIKNSTTGGQAIDISQGSGGNVTIANGETKAVYGDGAGSGAAVTDYLAGLVIGGAFGAEGAVTLESTLDVTGLTTLANLTATGTINFSGATVSDGGTVTTIDIDGGTADGVVIGSASAAAGTFTTVTGSGNLNVGTGLLFADVSGTRVAVGTAAPNADDKFSLETTSGIESLTVSGIDNTANGYVRIDTAANRRNAVVWETAGTAAFAMERGDSDDGDATSLYLHAGAPDGGASSDFVLDSSGNVGLGTAAPSEVLDVTGNLKASGTHYSDSGSFSVAASGTTTEVISGLADFAAYLVTFYVRGANMELSLCGLVLTANGDVVVRVETLASGDFNTGSVQLQSKNNLAPFTFSAGNGNAFQFVCTGDGSSAQTAEYNIIRLR
jgi:hypothetical protein